MSTEKKGADIFAIACGIIGAVVLGSIAADRTGKWIFGSFVGLFVGAGMASVLRYVLSHLRSSASDPSVRRESAPFYIVIASAVLGLVIYSATAPEKPVLPPIPVPLKPVHVSGYVRQDGTVVSSYNRALPGQATSNSARTLAWSHATGRILDKYNSERNTAAFLSIGVFAVGCFLAYRKSKAV